MPTTMTMLGQVLSASTKRHIIEEAGRILPQSRSNPDLAPLPSAVDQAAIEDTSATEREHPRPTDNRSSGSGLHDSLKSIDAWFDTEIFASRKRSRFEQRCMLRRGCPGKMLLH
jgi:hypothetical protein